jgi:hypothetical protein
VVGRIALRIAKKFVSAPVPPEKGVLAFLAQDADQRVFCYANPELRKAEHPDEILRFVEFWQQRTGRRPEELVFDSRLRTYKNLNRLNPMGIRFLTLRRRSRRMLEKISQVPASARHRVELKNVARAYRTPRLLATKITSEIIRDPFDN